MPAIPQKEPEIRTFLRSIKLQTQIVLLVSGIVVIVLTVANVLVTRNITAKVWGEQGELAMAIAKIVAAAPIVVSNLEGEQRSRELRLYAEQIEKASGIQFVVIIDMKGIRKTHPDPARIGEHMVGGDEQRAIHGESYLSFSEGSLGPSYRAFVPVLGRDGKQIGTVITGILVADVERMVGRNLEIMYSATFVGLILGAGCAIFLGKRVRRTLFGLEPEEIARRFQENSAIIQSVYEGIIAVNRRGEITVFNTAAKHIMGIPNTPDEQLIGQLVGECITETRLMEVMETGISETDQEQIQGNSVVLTNRRPVYVDGRLVGAVATFRDMTEVRQMAEEVTGVCSYVDALRAQAHEFMNKMLVILGLIKLGSYKELSTYITDVVDKYQEETAAISSMVRDPVVAAFLLSKCNRANELGVDILLDNDSDLPTPLRSSLSHALVLILGNLIDNALDALAGRPQRYIDIWMRVEHGRLNMEVSDSGPGISTENLSRIFEKGYTSKEKHGGFGLFLVRETVERFDGEISVSNNQNDGALFHISLPYEVKLETPQDITPGASPTLRNNAPRNEKGA